MPQKEITRLEIEATFGKLLGSQRAFVLFPRPKDVDPEKPQTIFLKCITGGWGCGKAVSLDTRIPTPRGWTTMGEIKVGDQVFDENGNVCNVVAATEPMFDHDCYRVTFDNDESVIADKDHEWKTITIADRDRHARQVLKKAGVWGKETYTTEEIAKTLIYNDKWKTKTHCLKLCAIKGRETSLPIHPYVLGAWLGDGSSASSAITGDDPAIFERIESFGWKIGPPSREKGCPTRSVYGLQTELKKLGIWGHKTKKRIPIEYLRASFEQRLWLLKGLLDTDGGCTKSGSVEFCSIVPQLARDAFELANSLGLKASFHVGNATLNGRFICKKYRVFFVPEFPVFDLSRKLNRQKSSTQKRNTKRQIISVEPVPSVPVKCIRVDSPSNLFLITDSFIPTHNSKIGILQGLMLSQLFPGNEGMIGRFHGKDLEESIIPLFFESCPESWIKSITGRGKTGMIVRLINGSTIYFKHIHDAGASGTKTRRVGANLGWVLLDQVEELELEHVNAMMGRLRNPIAKLKMLICTANPNGRDWHQKFFFPNWEPLDAENGVFFRTYQQGNVFGVHVDSQENRISNGGFVEDDFFDNIIQNQPPDWVARYIHGSFEDFSGKVYKGYTLDSPHNIDPFPIPSNWSLTVPIDVGGSCPWAVVPMYSDDKGNLIITEGFHDATGKTADVANWIKTHLPWSENRTTYVIDPENKLAAVELADLGIYCRNAIKDVHPGILRMGGYFNCRRNLLPPEWFIRTQSSDAVERLKKFGCPKIFIFKTALQTRTEHDECVWDDKKPNTIKKTAQKRFDTVDAVRYGGMSRPDSASFQVFDKYEEVRQQDPLSAKEIEEFDRQIALLSAAQKGGSLREAFCDTFIPPVPERGVGVRKWDWVSE